ncbi:hypothetical protein MNB_SV-5-361 [hydrothermal vent metagenome]|uniref:Uncharacterized protein n=1 Tax=hydrothermal vent metagenome TaxID=652676 RepID=A0A1W1EFB7_9ZZZZ
MSEEVLDEWQILLKQKRVEVEKCQLSHEINSCLKCKDILNCELRDTFVKSVYDSMSKGKGGGFEF